MNKQEAEKSGNETFLGISRKFTCMMFLQNTSFSYFLDCLFL